MDAQYNGKPEQLKKDTIDNFKKLSGNKDLGTFLCDPKNNHLKTFNRYLCYSYFEDMYFKYNPGQKEKKSTEVFQEVSTNFDAIYKTAMEVSEIKYQIATQMDCDLAD